MSKYHVSDAFIRWAQSLSGMLTTIRAENGSAAEMLEHPQWDEGKTQLALALVASLNQELSVLHAEIACHVKEKYG